MWAFNIVNQCFSNNNVAERWRQLYSSLNTAALYQSGSMELQFGAYAMVMMASVSLLNQVSGLCTNNSVTCVSIATVN